MEMNNMGKRKNRQKKQAKKKAAKQMKITQKNTGTWVSKQSCHTGHNLIFKTPDGVEVWAGGRNRSGGWHLMNPLPQLAIAPSETLGMNLLSSKTEVPEGWSCEQHLTNGTPPHFISLDWPDFSIPNVSKYFWYALLDDIKEFDIKVISTQCAGGHGRTGVQLAILAHFLIPTEQHTWNDAAELIEWVREQHCTHAVEAKSQQQYIAEVCEIPVGEDKVHSSWGGGYGGYGGWSTQYDPPNYKVADKGKGTTKRASTTDDLDMDYDDLIDAFHADESIDEYTVDGTMFCPACSEYHPLSEFADGEPECIECYAELTGVASYAGKFECGICREFFKTTDITRINTKYGDLECKNCDKTVGVKE